MLGLTASFWGGGDAVIDIVYLLLFSKHCQKNIHYLFNSNKEVC